MLRIRDDQMEALAQARRVELARALYLWLETERPGDATNSAVAARTVHVGHLVGIDELEQLQRLTAVVALEGFPDLDDRWGEAIVNVATDEAVDPEARLEFLERDLLPRRAKAMSRLEDAAEAG